MMRTIALLAGVVPSLLIVTATHAEHVPAHVHEPGGAGWIERDPTTHLCCGDEDCRPLAESEVSFRDGQWFVLGQPVPADKVYPTKPEGGSMYWGCFTLWTEDKPPRCLFIPAMF